MSAQVTHRIRRAVFRIITVLLTLTTLPVAVHGASVTFEHSANGRLTKATYDDGTVVNYAYDANGNRTAAIVTPPLDATSPSVPGSLTATAVSQTQIDLNWAASTDNVGVTGYRLQRCTGTGCTGFSQVATLASTSYSDGGRSPNTTSSTQFGELAVSWERAVGQPRRPVGGYRLCIPGAREGCGEQSRFSEFR